MQLQFSRVKALKNGGFSQGSNGNRRIDSTLLVWCRFLYLPVSLGRTARYTLHAKFGRRMRPWWDEFCFSSSYDITRTFLFVLRVGKGKKRSQLNPRSLLSVGNSPRLEILESGGSVIHREVFKHPTYL